MTKQQQLIRRLIKEYAGIHFYFLENYLDADYTEYVQANIRKIVYYRSFGKEFKRREYKKFSSNELLLQFILNECEQTVNYVKEKLKDYRELRELCNGSN